MSACLVCGSDRMATLFRASDRLYHTTAKEFDVVRCGACGLIRLEPQPGEEELPLYYPRSYWFAPNENAAGRLEEAYRRLVLRDPLQFLATAHGLLAAGGRLVVQVPNAASWQARLLGRSWNGVDIPRHLFDFRDLDLEKLLAACQFEVLRRKYFSLRDNPAGFASSLAPALDPMARRVRRTPESGAARLLKDLAYFGLVLAALPFTLAEAACHAGSTVMIEARKR